MWNRPAQRASILLCAACALSQTAWGQWSSNPATNLPIAVRLNNDQVQPKLRPLPNDQWYLSWFDANPNSPPPVGYDVFLQRLSPTGVAQYPHYGVMVADLSNSSTEDYGLDIDTTGNALLAFQDTREGSNLQITAAKIDRIGNPVWGPKGVQLTNDQHFNAVPKIAGTTDGMSVVAWTSDSNVVVQKLDASGAPVWPAPLVFSQPGYDFTLADLHAADDGSVILSWAESQGFGSNSQLRANKISADGALLWGPDNVVIFDEGSLQFGNFPYFITDGAGGALFVWYTASPTLQVFTQHISKDGNELFPHNGVAGSTNQTDVRVEPSVAYLRATDETFIFWTEEDSLQVYNGVYGQKFNGKGHAEWGSTGLVVVPLGLNTQDFVKTVMVGPNPLVIWVDSPGYGRDTIQATLLDDVGYQVCPQFPVSTAPATKYGLSVAQAASGLTALAWTDDRIGNNGIYVQNINADCSLGK